MRPTQIEKVHRAAVALFGDGNTARGIATMEGVYLDHLTAEGSPDTETRREMFGADKEPFWHDAWKQARGGVR